MKPALLSVFLILATPALLHAVSGTLNYQGQLFLNNSPAAGPVDITFRMFTTPTGGTALWTETDNGVTVTAGLFSTTLGDNTPFPANLFTAQVPWLEMEVNGQTLTPRTQFHSVPYALNAAVSTGNELWQSDGTNVWRGTGRVGIGTAAPIHGLHVIGPFDPANNLGVTFESQDAGSVGPVIDLYHNSASPLPNDLAGAIRFFGKDASTNKEEYAALAVDIVDPAIGNEGSDIRFRTMTEGALDDRMTIKGRYVGINTTSPTSDLDLRGLAQVAESPISPDTRLYATLGVTRGNSPGSHGYIGMTKSGFVPWAFGIDTDDHMIIGTASATPARTIPNPRVRIHPWNGNVGIGSVTTGHRLTVGGSQLLATAGGNSEMRFQMQNDLPSYQGGLQYHYNYQNALRLVTWSDDRQILGAAADGYKVFFPTGNVGIGTTDPTAKLHVVGDFIATGTKCREVDTPSHGKLYFNATEDARALFTLSGESQLQRGRAVVTLDPKWLASVTIDAAHPMRVWISFNDDPGGWHHVRKGTTQFSVFGPTGSTARFDWKVEARQRGYEDIYLDRSDPLASRWQEAR